MDTSMGFTPLDGLIMATRSGGLDPGLILWLQQWAGISASELAETLERRSGLLALAGSADMRSIEMAALRGDETACLALEAYARRLVSFIAAMVAAMGGIDALVFTGGVGENSPGVRRLSADRLAFLGLSVDPENNARGSGDRVISARPASVRVLVVECREDLQMAKEARELLAARSRLPQS